MELIKFENNAVVLDEEISKEIANFEKSIKELKAKEDELKKALLNEMEERNILKVENDDITITYVAPTDRESFNSKKFREDYSDLYDEYVEIKPVSSSIRIKVK